MFTMGAQETEHILIRRYPDNENDVYVVDPPLARRSLAVAVSSKNATRPSFAIRARFVVHLPSAIKRRLESVAEAMRACTSGYRALVVM